MDSKKKTQKPSKEMLIPSVSELIDVPEAVMSSIDKDIDDELKAAEQEAEESSSAEDDFDDLPGGEGAMDYSEEGDFAEDVAPIEPMSMKEDSFGAALFQEILSSPERRLLAEKLSKAREDFILQQQAMEAALPEGISLDSVFQIAQAEILGAFLGSPSVYGASGPEGKDGAQEKPKEISPRKDVIRFLKANDGLLLNIALPEGGMSPVSYEFIGGNEEFLLLGLNPEVASESSFYNGAARDLSKKSPNASMPSATFILPFSAIPRGIMLSDRVTLVDGYHPESKKVTPERAIEPVLKEEQLNMQDQDQEVYQRLVNLALTDASRFFSVLKKNNISLTSAALCMKSHGFVYNNESRSFVQIPEEVYKAPVQREASNQRAVPDGYASSIAQLANSLRK